MVTTLKENGRTIKQTDTVHTYTQMVLNMRASGERTCRMGSELKHGLMAQNIMGSIRWARNKVMVSMSGMMGPDIRVFGTRTEYRGLVCIHG